MTNGWKEPPGFQLPGETKQDAIAREMRYGSQFTKGEPKGTEDYSSTALRSMGMIGLYELVDESFYNQEMAKHGDERKMLAAWFDYEFNNSKRSL